jgi:hypothetical protein
VSKSKQKTLNGKAVIDLEAIAKTLQNIEKDLALMEVTQSNILECFLESLRELLGSRPLFGPQTTVSSHAAESPPPVAGELPPDLLPYLKKKSETAYDIIDEGILQEDGKLVFSVYKDLKERGWAYSPAKKLIWKPKEGDNNGWISRRKM